jgi:hypothetical protein
MIMDTHTHKLRGGEGVIDWVEVQGCKCEIFSPTSENHIMHDKQPYDSRLVNVQRYGKLSSYTKTYGNL